ncbi:TetR/AcrR family transcriptional regulator [Peterkaempfera bronchialis]|uniref:TetR/AcrR family transcriptional regulator n=2 Tax=Streptomycetaceae TaxID=2062 RepID=A0A345SZJ6_9ACTN|nr:TetR/AcrR family transcriptional regulator [Peterkaempfera bronchialis]
MTARPPGRLHKNGDVNGSSGGSADGTAGPPAGRERRPARRGSRVRMTGKQRREQLLDIGRTLFAERGYDGTSVEEIAAKAGVSKPVVYEHFGGKEGLYAVVVDREMQLLLDMVTGALTGGHPRVLLEEAAFALLDYIETSTDGFRILVRDSPVAQSTGTFASLISDIATQVEDILGLEFKSRGFDPKLAPMYSQMLVGMVALTGQWWLEVRKPKKAEVAAHLVNLAWHGLEGMERRPRLMGDRKN